MLLIGLISLLIAIPLYSSTITPTLLIRITSILLLYSAGLSYNGMHLQSISSGLGLFSGLFNVTSVTQTIEFFLLLTGSIILLYNYESNMSWSFLSGEKTSQSKDGLLNTQAMDNKLLPEYPIIILFTTTGSLFLISSSDLVSIYLSIELQSFAVYILAAIYRNSESATSAGLKYFLLGALSSALILLGSSLIYAYTGLTNFDNILMLSFDNFSNIGNNVTLGFFIISIGFIFKVAAAPFHNWAPDVYDGVPTIVTTWLTIIPKISIFVFLLEVLAVYGDINLYTLKSLLLVTSILSLVIGTVVGLAQYKIKRLLAYSTISHVGFLLLALSVNSENSVSGFLFYLIQYSITNLNVFLVILAFGSLLYYANDLNDGSDQGNPDHNQDHNNVNLSSLQSKKSFDLTIISQLKGQFHKNPILALSFAICLFSIAGIPPLVGFFAKYKVLFSAIENGYFYLALVGIFASVISAAYYLRVIRVLHFDPLYPKAGIGKSSSIAEVVAITSVHSYIIAVLTLAITLFILAPTFLLNSSNLLALTLFTA